MLKKSARGRFELKADQPGKFRATFATFNAIDKDNDVTLPGAFQSGQAVRIAAWGHNWGDLVVGKGVIDQDDSKAWVDGEFFLTTIKGKEHYETVKALGDLQEWSYGFEIKDQSFGEFEGRDVRFLRALDVFEVSPVMIGAGVGTGTDDIKAAPALTAAERKTLESARARAVAYIANIDAVLGTTEDNGSAKAEGDETVKAEGSTEVKGDDPVRRDVVATQVAAELVELGVE